MEIFGQPEVGSSRPFSRAVKAGGMVWVSGHTAPHEPDQGIHRGETAADEVRHALQFIAGVLAQAGSSLDRVVQVTMLLSNRADYAACNAEYVKHFPGGLPARHTVLFGVPSEARVGFACVAVVKPGAD